MLDLARLLFLGAAGVVLYLLGRTVWGSDPRFRWVVITGFLVRALLGQILFWISYLALPVAPELQTGQGLWFFATDARLYAARASAAAAGGLDDIVRLPASTPSVTYGQALSLFVLLFGNAVSASLLLNLFCYLATCAIIVRWSATSPGSCNAALVALAAVSLSPAGVLWSLQPLKDTLFQFLIIAFFGACFLWQRAWRTENAQRQIVWAAVAMVIAHYLLSGIRWYVGLILFAIVLFLFPLAALTLRSRRLTASAAALLVLLVLSRTCLYAAGPYLPPPLANVLRFRNPPTHLPQAVFHRIDHLRGGFDRAGGNTAIHPAPNAPEPAIAKTDTAANSVPPRDTRSVQRDAAPREPQAVQVFASASKAPAESAADAPPESSRKSASHAAPPPVAAAPEPASAAPPNPSHAAAEAARKTPGDATTNIAVHAPPKPVITTVTKPAADAATAPKPALDAAAKPASERAATSTAPAPKPAPKSAIASKSAPKPSASSDSKKAPAPAAAKPAPAERPQPATAVAPAPKKVAPPALVKPARVPTTSEKFVAGVAAAALPRAIATRFGILEIGGGRNFWWFAELDTIVFDLLLLATLISVFRHFRSGSHRNLVFWLLVIATVVNGAALVYTVTNFGTLFRLRLMIFTSLALIPLALTTAPAAVSSPPAAAPRSPAFPSPG